MQQAQWPTGRGFASAVGNDGRVRFACSLLCQSCRCGTVEHVSLTGSSAVKSWSSTPCSLILNLCLWRVATWSSQPCCHQGPSDSPENKQHRQHPAKCFTDHTCRFPWGNRFVLSTRGWLQGALNCHQGNPTWPRRTRRTRRTELTELTRHARRLKQIPTDVP